MFPDSSGRESQQPSKITARKRTQPLQLQQQTLVRIPEARPE